MILPDLLSLMGEPVVTFGLCSFFLLLLALPFAFWSVGEAKCSSKATTLVALANISLATLLIIRWLQSGHFPISNLYESLCFLSWACTFTQLLLERYLPSPLIAAAITPISLICIAFASFKHIWFLNG